MIKGGAVDVFVRFHQFRRKLVPFLIVFLSSIIRVSDRHFCILLDANNTQYLYFESMNGLITILFRKHMKIRVFSAGIRHASEVHEAMCPYAR